METLREKLFGPKISIREKLATANSTLSVMPETKPKYSYTKPEELIPVKFGLPGMGQSKKITKETLKFQDSSPGFRGMSYIDDGDKQPFLDEFDYTPPKPKQIIKRLEILDPRDKTVKDTERQGTVIDDTETLKVFNTIKAVADDIAPEYTDYLLKLGWYEGRGNAKNRNDNGEKGVDRGIFQINNKNFPDIPDEFADDPVKATLWAISVIEANKQKKWVADKHVKAAKTNIEYK